jgi:hypothetical protein
MYVIAPPLTPAIWDALSTEAQALIRASQMQVVALQAEAAAPHAQRRELHARLGQHAATASPLPASAFLWQFPHSY